MWKYYMFNFDSSLISYQSTVDFSKTMKMLSIIYAQTFKYDIDFFFSLFAAAMWQYDWVIIKLLFYIKPCEWVSINSIHIRNIWNGCVTTEWTTKLKWIPAALYKADIHILYANKAIWCTDKIKVHIVHLVRVES